MSNYEAVFLRTDERQPPQPLFFRFIGTDAAGETEAFLTRYRALAATDGLLFSSAIPDPWESDLNRLRAITGDFSRVTEQAVSAHVTAWLTQLWQNQQSETAKAVWSLVKYLKSRGMREETLRGVYTALLCRLSTPCGRALRQTGSGDPPKVLYEGDITAQELYLLYTLSLAGCDVVYAHHSEESYLVADPVSRFSVPVRGVIFTPRAIPPAKPEPEPPPAEAERKEARSSAVTAETVRADLDKVAGAVQTNLWLGEGDVWAAALDDAGRGGSGTERRNLFVLCFGADERENYRNRLFFLREKLRASGKKWIIMSLRTPPPNEEEKAALCGADTPEELAARLVAGDEFLTLLARRALLALLDERAAGEDAVDGAAARRLACWLARYAEALFTEARPGRAPLFLYYGPITPEEVDLLWLLKEIGADVLYFSPDKADKEVFRRRTRPLGAREIELPGSLPWEPFPEEELRLRAETVAYNASRELDRILYSDTGLFRQRQFPRSRPATLKTTYDEIPLLWPVEAKYRPNFQAEGGVVTVPNIFAKICGVEKGLTEVYWDKIAALVTEQTFLVTRLPFFPRAGAREAEAAREFWRDGGISPTVKKSRVYRYEHLPLDTQDFLLEKAGELLQGNLLRLTDEERFQALAVLLTLEQEILRLIQNYDYTRVIPKLLVVSAADSVFALEDCVYAAFLNMTGFDVAVFTPTGNRDIETYIDAEHFETHQIGEYLPGLEVPDLRQRRKNLRPKSWLGKLLGRGKE
ncbi:MAG: YceG family protein [Gracilibacteraceae bacterium]|jgi:hypothetical protein|nr:YceG family protein [Gracilibacteraceae bacterium]